MLPRNMAIVAIILVCGIGGMSFDLIVVKLGGIGLAGIVGVLLNLILPCKDCNDPLPDEVSPSAPDHHTDLQYITIKEPSFSSREGSFIALHRFFIGPTTC